MKIGLFPWIYLFWKLYPYTVQQGGGWFLLISTKRFFDSLYVRMNNMVELSFNKLQ